MRYSQGQKEECVVCCVVVSVLVCVHEVYTGTVHCISAHAHKHIVYSVSACTG